MILKYLFISMLLVLLSGCDNSLEDVKLSEETIPKGGFTPKEDWKITYDKTEKKEANITSEFDEVKQRKIIFLDGDGEKVSFSLGSDWNDTETKVIQWSMKTNENFAIKFNIDTDKGKRIIEYHAKDTGEGFNEYTWTTTSYIIHGLGSSTTDGKWQTYRRDIRNDLKRYEADNNLKAINSITFRGNARLDNVVFYKDNKDFKVDKPVVVSAPGIVLTFDDSYANNWYDMKNIFEQKGALVTFFCNRWGTKEDQNLTEDELAKFRAFEGDGHEIGYHTQDHKGTRDPKYDTTEDKAQAYFDDQIELGLDDMREKGFEPESFSYPYSSGQPAHNKIIRKVLPHIRNFFGHVTLIDERGGKTLADLKKLLDKYKKERDIGIFVGHWILSDNFEPNNPRYSYRTSKEKLIQLIDYANEIGLKFYTLEEAHKIYLEQMKGDFIRFFQ